MMLTASAGCILQGKKGPSIVERTARIITAIGLPIFLIALVLTAPMVRAKPDIVYSDSKDGCKSNFGFVETNTVFVGDVDSPVVYFKGFVRFSLSGISGTIASAKLYLYVYRSYLDGVGDTSSPLTNPGLGDCRVIHIADYGTLAAADLNAPSIGNDPGVLLSGTATPNVGYISIDVTAAMQDDINNGRAYSAFRIELETNTDGDKLFDGWYFYASEETGTDYDPYIEYTLRPPPPPPRPSYPVGGILTSVNKLAILAPYMAFIGLAAVAVAAIKKRKR